MEHPDYDKWKLDNGYSDEDICDNCEHSFQDYELHEYYNGLIGGFYCMGCIEDINLGD